MGLDALLSRLESRAVTPVTPAETRDVTAKAAPALACTPVTAVTALSDVTAGPGAFRWLLHFPGREPMAVTFSPAVDHAGALWAYPEAIAAVPVLEPAAVPVPADLLALFDACVQAGLYDDEDCAVLRSMYASAPDGTRGLIEAMHSLVRSCRP